MKVYLIEWSYYGEGGAEHVAFVDRSAAEEWIEKNKDTVVRRKIVEVDLDMGRVSEQA